MAPSGECFRGDGSAHGEVTCPQPWNVSGEVVDWNGVVTSYNNWSVTMDIGVCRLRRIALNVLHSGMWQSSVVYFAENISEQCCVCCQLLLRCTASCRRVFCCCYCFAVVVILVSGSSNWCLPFMTIGSLRLFQGVCVCVCVWLLDIFYQCMHEDVTLNKN